MLGSKLAELRRGIERFTERDGVHRTAIAPLSLARASTSSRPEQTIHEPVLGIVAQGSKRVMLADEIYRYDAARLADRSGAWRSAGSSRRCSTRSCGSCSSSIARAT